MSQEYEDYSDPDLPPWWSRRGEDPTAFEVRLSVVLIALASLGLIGLLAFW